jgi:hypothetical protein
MGICFKYDDTNNKFNSFLFTFLSIFEASFPIKYKSAGRPRPTNIRTYEQAADVH